MIKLLLVAVCLLVVAQAAVHKVEVKKLGESRSAKLLKEGKPHEFKAFRHALRRNYNLHLDHVKNGITKSRAGRLASQPLYDYYDQAYTAVVSIGTPAQQFTLLLDTFSGDTWVPDSTCSQDVCGCTDQDDDSCQAKSTFDSSASSTYKVDGRQFIDNNTGGVGFLGVDTVKLGDDLTISGVTFGQVSQPFEYIKYYPFDGFLGLTYKSVDGVNSVIQEAAAQNLLDAPIFTLYLQADGFDSNGKLGGQITYGAVDTDHCSSNVYYTPVRSQNVWEFEIEATEIGGLKQTGNNWLGFADSSSSIIGVNEAAFNDIVSATGAQYNDNFGMYEVPCDTQLSWGVTLGGHKFVVDESNTVYNYDGTCLLLFEIFEYPDFAFLLGGPFIED